MLELITRVTVEGIEKFDKLSDAISQVAGRTKISAGELKLFNDVLKSGVDSGQKADRVLRDIAASTSSVGSSIAGLAREVREQIKEQDRAAASAQRMGNIVNRAYAENTKRALESAAAAKSAADAQLLSNTRAGSLLTRVAGRASGAALGGSTGIPGLGFGLGSALSGAASGIGDTALIVGGITAASVAASVALIKVAKDTAELAREQSNSAQRTNLSIKDYGLFAAATREVGVNAQSLTTGVRTLSKALSDNEQEGRVAKAALKEIGVEATNAFGGFEGGRKFLEDFDQALQKLSGPGKEDVILKVFGRGGLELLPRFNGDLRNSLTELEKLGVGFDDFSAKSALNFDSALNRMTTRFKTFMKDLGVGVAEAVGFEDPGKALAENARRTRERSLRFQQTTLRTPSAVTGKYYNPKTGLYDLSEQAALELTPAELAPRGIAGPSTGDLNSQLSTSKRTQINAILQGGDKGLQGQLKNAERELQEAITSNDPSGVATQQGRIESLQKQIKALEQIKALDKEIFAAEEAAELKPFGAAGTIEARRRDFDRTIAQTDLSPRDKTTRRNRAGAAFDTDFAEEIQKEHEKTFGKDFSVDLPNGVTTTADQAGFTKPQIDLREKTDKSSETEVKEADKAARDYVNGIAKELKASSKSFEEVDKIKLDADRDGINRNSRAAGARASAAAGPGQEGKAIEDAYRIRLELAQQLFNLEQAHASKILDNNLRRIADARALGDLQKARQDAEVDQETKLIELRAKGLQDYRNQAGKLFDDIKAKPSTGFADFFKSEATGIGRTVFQNAAEKSFKPGSLQLPGQGTTTDPSFLGQLLKGTPFGLNALNDPQVKQTDAVKLNTTALTDLTATLTAGGGSTGLPGVPGSGNSGVLGLGGLFVGTGTNGISTLLPGISGDRALTDGLSQLAGGVQGSRFSTTGSTIKNFLGGITGLAGGANVFKAISGSDYSITGANGNATTASASGLTSAAGRAGTIVGAGGAVFGAAEGIYSGIKQGGAKGVTKAIGSALGGAAALDPEPISKAILGAGALITSIVGGFLGDPKAQRLAAINKSLAINTVAAPTGQQYVADSYGHAAAFDNTGGAHATASVKYNTGVYQNPLTGQVNDGWGNPYAFDQPNRNTTPPSIVVNQNISTMDSKSFKDNANHIADAFQVAVLNAHGVTSVLASQMAGNG